MHTNYCNCKACTASNTLRAKRARMYVLDNTQHFVAFNIATKQFVQAYSLQQLNNKRNFVYSTLYTSKLQQAQVFAVAFAQHSAQLTSLLQNNAQVKLVRCNVNKLSFKLCKHTTECECTQRTEKVISI